MSQTVEPTYTDPSHPIYRALPLADALDVLDRRQVPSDMSPAAIADEAVLIDAGEAAGGLSTDGFRADLIGHVARAERDEDEAIFDDHASYGHRGFYNAKGEPCLEAYRHGCKIAEAWIATVTAALAAHGRTFDGRGIVAVQAMLVAA